MVDDKLRTLTQEALHLATSSEEKDFYQRAYTLFSQGLERHIDKIVYLKKKGNRKVLAPSPTLKKFHRTVMQLLHNCGAYRFNESVIGSVKGRSRKNLLKDKYRRYASKILADRFKPEDSKKIIMIKVDIRRAFESLAEYRVHGVLRDALELILLPLKQGPSGPEREALLAAGIIPVRGEVYNTNSKWDVKVRQCNYLYQLLDELVGICVYKSRLPIGLPLSPAIFNMALRTIDSRIERALAALAIKNSTVTSADHHGLDPYLASGSYYRYVDDIIIFTHRANKAIIKITHRILQSEGLKLNPRKTKVIPLSSGWSGLGMTVSAPLVPPTKKFMKKARGLWHRWATMKDEKAYEKLKGMIASAEHYPFENGAVAKKLGLRIARTTVPKNRYSRHKGPWELVPLDQ
mgnify:CR=1 FL=1|jgi:hypothetical protein